jgi:hypothetical protein
MAQLDMSAAEALPQPSIAADPDRVRRKLQALLSEARAAGVDGLPQGRRRLIGTLVPQMTRWLPDEEAESVRQTFQAALAA